MAKLAVWLKPVTTIPFVERGNMGLAQFSQTAKLVHFYDILAFNSKKLKWNKNDNLTRKILKFDINKIPVDEWSLRRIHAKSCLDDKNRTHCIMYRNLKLTAIQYCLGKKSIIFSWTVCPYDTCVNLKDVVYVLSIVCP